MLKLFKIVNLKDLKDNIVEITFVLIGCIISTSLLSATIFILDNINNYVNTYSTLINHGDLSVSQENIWFGEEQYKQNNRELDKYLAQCDNIKYTYEQMKMPEFAARLGIKGGNTIPQGQYWYRLINFDDIDRYAYNIDSELKKDSVILSKTMARRLSAKVGDILDIRFGISTPVLSLPVSLIIPDNEINIAKANLGYLMLDLSEFKKWYFEPDKDLENIWIKKYYIDADETELYNIETKVYSLFGQNSKVVYATNMFEQAKDFFSFPIAFFSFFTVICFIFSSIGLLNLCYIRILKRQKYIAIYKIFGLTNSKNILFMLLEMIILILPTYIIGITIGYIMFLTMLSNTTSLGIYSMTIYSILISIIKIIVINLITVLLICIPLVVYVYKTKIIDVLRDNSPSGILKLQVVLLGFCSTLLIMLLFDIILDSDEVNSILFKTFIGAGTILVISILITKLLYFFRSKSYLHISFTFIRKNILRVPMTIITYSFCFCMVFIMALANYTLNSLAYDTSTKEYDYNVEVELNNEDENKFNQFITTQLNLDNYYIVKSYASKLKDLFIEFDVYDFSNYNGFMEIGDNLIISSLLKGRDIVKEGEKIDLFIQDSPTPVSYTVGSGNYKSSFLSGQGLSVAISAKGSGNLPKNADIIGYFLNLTKSEEQILRDYVKVNKNIKIISTEDIIKIKLGEIIDYRYMFNLMTVYFVICTFIIAFSCSLITYINRSKDFCIYKIFGATTKTVRKMIFFENLIIISIGIICGVMISNYSLDFISRILDLELYMDYFLISVLIFVFLQMVILITWIVLKIIPFKTSNELLRDE